MDIVPPGDLLSAVLPTSACQAVLNLTQGRYMCDLGAVCRRGMCVLWSVALWQVQNRVPAGLQVRGVSCNPACDL